MGPAEAEVSAIGHEGYCDLHRFNQVYLPVCTCGYMKRLDEARQVDRQAIEREKLKRREADKMEKEYNSALSVQVGGGHYKECTIQPIQYIEANKLSFLEGCVLKRITRHDKVTGKGAQDIKKAIHELQLLLELRYPPKELQEKTNEA